MNEDERQALKSVLVFVAVKALLFVAIHRLAKSLREDSEQFDPDFPHITQFTVAKGTDIIGPHLPINLKP